MKEKKFTWHKIAEHINEIQFAENNIGEAEINGIKICLARVNETIFAFTHRCPHAGGEFLNGRIDASGNIVCPLHHYKYDLKNGRNTSGEGFHLKNWPVQINEDGIYVGIEKGSSFWNLF